MGLRGYSSYDMNGFGLGRGLDERSILPWLGIDGLPFVRDGGLEAVDVGHVTHDLLIQFQTSFCN